MNKFYREFMAERDTHPLAKIAKIPGDIEETEEHPSSLYKGENLDNMTTDYSVRIVGGRKIYERGTERLVTFSKETCEKRINELVASGGDQIEFWDKATAWASEQPDEMHRKWAEDCNALLEAVYDRVVAVLPKQQEKPVLDLLGGF